MKMTNAMDVPEGHARIRFGVIPAGRSNDISWYWANVNYFKEVLFEVSFSGPRNVEGLREYFIEFYEEVRKMEPEGVDRVWVSMEEKVPVAKYHTTGYALGRSSNVREGEKPEEAFDRLIDSVTSQGPKLKKKVWAKVLNQKTE